MSSQMIVELAGYFGSALVLVSFLMTSVVKLRVINAAGGVICTLYSLIIHAYPTALMNTCLVIINLSYLIRMRKAEKAYECIEGGGEESMIRYLLRYYEADIQKYFPGWEGLTKNGQEAEHDLTIHCNTAYIVCHHADPAGILLGNKDEDGQLEVVLDYSTPAYRDCSVGKYLYTRLKEQGIRRLTFPGIPGQHESYLKTMGFAKVEGAYIKELAGAEE